MRALCPAIALLLLVLGARSAAADAAPIAHLSHAQEVAFRTAATAEGKKQERARADVEAWGPLSLKAAVQLRTLVRTKWDVSAESGWVGHVSKHGGMRQVDVPGLGLREYCLWVPDGYTPQRNWPLALSLHGAGGNGQQQFDWCWAKWTALWPGLIACPSGQPAGGQWFPEQRPFLLAVLDDLRRHFAIDDDHVSLDGFSNGGHGAWYYGSHYPSLWCAMLARSGAAYDEDLFANFLHVPCTVVHGTADTVIPIARDRMAVAKMKEAGCQVVFKEMPGGHNPFLDELNGELIPWLAKQKRDPFPLKFQMRSPVSEEHRAYWVEMVDRASVAEVHAAVDGQTIALTTTGCVALHLWLDDALVDLERPVTVSWNGTTVHQGLVPRRGADLLTWLASTGDRAAAPVAMLALTHGG